MNEVGVVALVLVAIWLLLLTFVVMLAVRQIALLGAAQKAGPAAAGANSLALGAAVPDDVLSILGDPLARQHLVLLSSNCAPCQDIAASWQDTLVLEPATLVVQGGGAGRDAILAHVPAGVDVLVDDDADTFFRGLEVGATPFAMSIDNGIVSGHLYITRIADLNKIYASERAGESSESTPTMAPVS
jgi:hypothetical protein